MVCKRDYHEGPFDRYGNCLTCNKKQNKEQKQELQCTKSNHIGPIQQFTECCLHCGRNIYD